jgi:hypothetical protein
LDKYGIHSTRPAGNKAKEQYQIRIPKREIPKVQCLVSEHSLIQCVQHLFLQNDCLMMILETFYTKT